MNEKDYLGKILELKERAEEDLYFAKRDRELITKLKQAHEVEHEDTLRKLARFRCPQCGARLQLRPLQDVIIQVCPACLGAWLSKEQLGTVMMRKGRRWVKSFLEGLVQLMEHPYGKQPSVEVAGGHKRADRAVQTAEKESLRNDTAD